MSDSQKNTKRKSQPRYWVEKNGSLYARLQYKDDLGKPRDKYKRITDKRKARSVVEAMRRELALHGEGMLQSDRITFKQVADEYAKTCAVPPVLRNGVLVEGLKSYKTVRIMVEIARQHFGAKRLRSIKPGDIEQFKRERLQTVTKHGKERSLASVHRELAYLRAILNFAVRQGYLANNPFNRTKGLISASSETQRDRILTADEEERLLSVCTGRRKHLGPVLICALDTAMRRGEIFKMRWEDVDFGAAVIRIPQTNTKTEAARTVGITGRLEIELKELWAQST
ncbi:MAG: tyrosine-type recombinase/integrase, partial [Pyrinomonadaceae bacterium]|nr:tyrosine-type recombinase/integrase [Pyrinomonadaceae bacterium]